MIQTHGGKYGGRKTGCLNFSYQMQIDTLISRMTRVKKNLCVSIEWQSSHISNSYKMKGEYYGNS